MARWTKEQFSAKIIEMGHHLDDEALDQAYEKYCNIIIPLEGPEDYDVGPPTGES